MSVTFLVQSHTLFTIVKDFIISLLVNETYAEFCTQVSSPERRPRTLIIRFCDSFSRRGTAFMGIITLQAPVMSLIVSFSLHPVALKDMSDDAVLWLASRPVSLAESVSNSFKVMVV